MKRLVLIFCIAYIVLPYLAFFSLADAEELSAEQLQRGRRIIVSSCVGCHTLDPILGASYAEDEGWRQNIQDMRKRGASISDEEINILSKYLSYLTRCK